jgi:hypothetical protein
MENMKSLIVGMREMQVSQHNIMVDSVCGRTPVQPPRKEPVKIAGHRRQRKHANRRAPPRGQFRAEWTANRGAHPRGQFREEWTALRRKRVYNNAGLNLRGTNAGCRRNQKGRGQYYVAVPLMRTERLSRNTRNGGMQVGYSGRATMMRKQFHARPESRNSGGRATPRRRLMLGNGSVKTFHQQQIRIQQYRNWKRRFLFQPYRNLWRTNGFRTVRHGHESRGDRNQ